MKFRGIAFATAILFTCASLASALPMQDQSSAPTPSAPAQASSQTAPAPAAAQDQYPAAPSQSTAADDPAAKKKGSGGKDDVDAIGNRKMGGKGLGDWYSLEKEVRMGKQFAQQVEASVKLVQDPVVNEYVNRIGQNLVRNSDAKVPFTIK